MDEVNFGMNQFCGPAVLSIFTGANTDDCAEEISKVTKQFVIKGVMPNDLMAAGNAMGLEFNEIPSFMSRSIFWTASVLTKLPSALYLVTIPKHYIALEVKEGTIFICDNHTKHEIELQNSARLSQKVERVWRVTKLRDYSRPRPIAHHFHAEILSGCLHVKKVIKMSDEGIKIQPLGIISVSSPQDIQDIAFEIMKLTGK